MIDYSPLFDRLNHSPLASWLSVLPQQIAEQLHASRWGDLPTWESAYEQLPEVTAEAVTLDTEVRVTGPCDDETRQEIERQLRVLHPWRKGPWHIHDIFIDTEWRSDWKWDRVLPHLSPLHGRTILDVGCGNGYHCMRMLGAGAKEVIGIDPSPKFIYQFYSLKKYLGESLQANVLPIGIEALPNNLQGFDSVFSMGVFYHRRSPMDHLKELKACLRPHGELVLETLVIEGPNGSVLVPPDRYAMMNNVWFLPSVPTLLAWLEKCGFKEPRCVDVCPTSTEEQRSTDWMIFHSLNEFLDPDDPNKTAEGHPAPVRAVFVATAPG
ncbi:MAG: tRNA 5-methoxyuridine(34)/uridine 5-oxyacetic acid(34) synthase CmoB [Cellvibrionaceae bacterium]